MTWPWKDLVTEGFPTDDFASWEMWMSQKGDFDPDGVWDWWEEMDGVQRSQLYGIMAELAGVGPEPPEPLEEVSGD